MSPGGLGLMQAIATLARRLVDGHRGQVKSKGFYAVLQATTCGKVERLKNMMIDCCRESRTIVEKELIMSQWEKRASSKGVQQTGAGCSLPKVNVLVKKSNVAVSREDSL